MVFQRLLSIKKKKFLRAIIARKDIVREFARNRQLENGTINEYFLRGRDNYYKCNAPVSIKARYVVMGRRIFQPVIVPHRRETILIDARVDSPHRSMRGKGEGLTFQFFEVHSRADSIINSIRSVHKSAGNFLS